MILGTAGHIDHGKTTLVRALTGVDTDRLPEEKRRGITIELGFAPLVLDGIGTVGVVDVPGHEAFVRTMVAGATGIDLALVVVAADEGVMPQTREHLAILELLGVRRGVVALTKADLVDDEWLALVEEDVRDADRARRSRTRAIVATSAQSGRGTRRAARRARRRRRATVPRARDDDLFRLPVDRAFTIKGTGTVVTGTVWSGRAHARRDRAHPSRRPHGARARRFRATARSSTRRRPAVAHRRRARGRRVARRAARIDARHRSRLASDHRSIRADVSLVPGAEAAIRPRTWLRFHVGTAEVGRAHRDARRRPRTRRSPRGSCFDEPVLLRAGDRFVLRTSAPLNTIARRRRRSIRIRRAARVRGQRGWIVDAATRANGRRAGERGDRCWRRFPFASACRPRRVASSFDGCAAAVARSATRLVSRDGARRSSTARLVR